MKLPLRYIIVYISTIAGGTIFFTGAKFLPTCVFRSITGIPCPSCGITTSVLLAMRGDINGAVHAHPFGPIVIIGIAAAMALALYGLVKRSRLEWLFGRWMTGIAIIVIITYILVWLIRFVVA